MSRSARGLRKPSMRLCSTPLNSTSPAPDNSLEPVAALKPAAIWPVIQVRPCQKAYYEDDTPSSIRSDKDADIFKKHSSNVQTHSNKHSDADSTTDSDCPRVVIVHRDAEAEAEDDIAIDSRVPYPARSSSLLNRDAKSVPTVPPIPERSALRLQLSTSTGYVGARTDSVVTKVVVSEQADEDQANFLAPGAVTKLIGRSLRSCRERFGSCKVPSEGSNYKQTDRHPLTMSGQAELLDGRMTIYLAIHHAREKRLQKTGDYKPVHWLKFDEDLAADARVTASGEDLRASLACGGRRGRHVTLDSLRSTANGNKVNSEFDGVVNKRRTCTRIEKVKSTGQTKIIGPASYGALTLGEIWAGGHDEDVFETITDTSFRYIGVTRSRSEGKWIVHLAKEQPTKTTHGSATTRNRYMIPRKPLPTSEPSQDEWI